MKKTHPSSLIPKGREKGEGRREKMKDSSLIPKIVEYQPNKVIIEASSQEPGFLFLSDTYYPGWEAYVDGAKTKVYRANFCFRAIKVPSGTHSVEFVYRPLSFRIGVIGSLMTLLALLGYGLLNKQKFFSFSVF